MPAMSAEKSAIYQALFELSQSISGHSDLDGLCRALSESLKKVIHFDILRLLLFNAASRTLQIYGLNQPNAAFDKNAHYRLPGDENPACWVWINQQPFFIAEVDRESRWPELIQPARASGVSSILLVPLTTGEHRLGVLALGFLNPSETGREEMDFIHRVASEFAVTIESHLARQQYLRERDRLQLLFDFSNVLVSKLSPDELFPAMSEQLHKVVDFDVLALAVLDKKTGELLISGLMIEGGSIREFEGIRGRTDGTPSAEALATSKPVLTDRVDFERFPSPIYRSFVDAGFRSSCSIPLISPNSILGTLELARTSGQPFQEDDVELLVQVARQIAIALENSLAYRELAEMKERLAIEKLYLEDEIRYDRHFGEMLGQSPVFQTVLKNIHPLRVARKYPRTAKRNRALRDPFPGPDTRTREARIGRTLFRCRFTLNKGFEFGAGKSIARVEGSPRIGLGPERRGRPSWTEENDVAGPHEKARHHPRLPITGVGPKQA